MNGDVDRERGLHTQECFDYAQKTMADSGRAFCIVQCADARAERLTAPIAAEADNVPSFHTEARAWVKKHMVPVDVDDVRELEELLVEVFARGVLAGRGQQQASL